MRYTDDQKDAIGHTKGNIQIIACAGSGKTQTISARIAGIILSGARKDEILAFTFTEKAANEMKLRIRSQLEELMPNDPELGGMYVGTIHSFCFQYLKEIRGEFRNYDVIDENKQLLFLSRHQFDIGIDKLRRNGDRLFSPITRFVRTVDLVKQNQIPDGTVQADSHQFHQCYVKYHELMHQHKFMDFSTIIEALVHILESDPSEVLRIRQKIKYIVVDEYQDINPIQEKLIHLIAGTKGNLCVVGDDDQAIFEFQGANVHNILTFADRYHNVKSVNLVHNFRSTDALIEAARDLIQYNTGTRLPKRMEHGKKYRKGEEGDICKIEFSTRQQEVEFVASKIKELRGYRYLESVDEEHDKQLYRGLDWGDFAVLVRNNVTAKDFIDVFKQQGIPFTARGTAGLFDRDEIRFMQMIFNYLCDMQIPTPSGLIDCSQSGLSNYYQQTIDGGRWTEIGRTLSDIKAEIEQGERFYPQHIYHRILRAMGVADDIFDEGKLFDFGRFSDLILDFETVNEWVNIKRLKSFVYFLNGYAESKADIGGLDDPTNLNTVTIQSIHKAKGLEYPVVFVPDLAKGRFPSQQRNRRPDVCLNTVDLSRYTSGDQGERRLFYVAITRSQKFLFLTMAHNIGHKKTYSRSDFFDEYVHDLAITGDVPDPTQRAHIDPTPRTILELIPTTFTDLQYFLTCPHDYLLRKLMGFSPTIDLSFGYGLQIHNLLNRMHAEHSGTSPSEEEVDQLAESDFFLRYTRGEIFDNMKNKAKQVLKNYSASFSTDFLLRLETEKPFEFVLDNALISGQIDLITRINPETQEVIDVNLIDFKTESKEGRSERDPLNRLQLRLYAIAAARALALNPVTSNVHYLSDNVRFEVDVSQEKLASAREMIRTAVLEIRNRNFKRSPGKHCDTCDFHLICSRGIAK